MFTYVPVSLACLRRVPKTPWVSYYYRACETPDEGFMSYFSLQSLLTYARVAWCHICGHVRRPPTCGSLSSKTMSGYLVPSTTALADACASSLQQMFVCDFRRR